MVSDSLSCFLLTILFPSPIFSMGMFIIPTRGCQMVPSFGISLNIPSISQLFVHYIIYSTCTQYTVYVHITSQLHHLYNYIHQERSLNERQYRCCCHRERYYPVLFSRCCFSWGIMRIYMCIYIYIMYIQIDWMDGWMDKWT